MAMALLRRLLAISVLVGVPLGSLWVLLGDYLPTIKRPLHDTHEVTRDLTEEQPFMVGQDRYRSLYLEDRRIAENIRRRYGTWPFDLPSAEACLEAGSLAEQDFEDQELAWSRLPTPEAIQVCLARTLNRFSDSDVALAWLQDQGLTLTDSLADIDNEGRTRFMFGWLSEDAGGPQAWWQGLPEKRRTVLVGLKVAVDICQRRDLCRQLDNPEQRAPYFVATVSTQSKFNK